jgi:hypothetical protein
MTVQVEPEYARLTFRDFNDQKPTDDWRNWKAEN